MIFSNGHSLFNTTHRHKPMKCSASTAPNNSTSFENSLTNRYLPCKFIESKKCDKIEFQEKRKSTAIFFFLKNRNVSNDW